MTTIRNKRKQAWIIRSSLAWYEKAVKSGIEPNHHVPRLLRTIPKLRDRLRIKSARCLSYQKRYTRERLIEKPSGNFYRYSSEEDRQRMWKEVTRQYLTALGNIPVAQWKKTDKTRLLSFCRHLLKVIEETIPDKKVFWNEIEGKDTEAWLSRRFKSRLSKTQIRGRKSKGVD